MQGGGCEEARVSGGVQPCCVNVHVHVINTSCSIRELLGLRVHVVASSVGFVFVFAFRVVAVGTSPATTAATDTMISVV